VNAASRFDDDPSCRSARQYQAWPSRLTMFAPGQTSSSPSANQNAVFDRRSSQPLQAFKRSHRNHVHWAAARRQRRTTHLLPLSARKPASTLASAQNQITERCTVLTTQISRRRGTRSKWSPRRALAYPADALTAIKSASASSGYDSAGVSALKAKSRILSAPGRLPRAGSGKLRREDAFSANRPR